MSYTAWEQCPAQKGKNHPTNVTCKPVAETGKAWIVFFLSSIPGHGMTKSICYTHAEDQNSSMTVTGLQQAASLDKSAFLKHVEAILDHLPA